MNVESFSLDISIFQLTAKNLLVLTIN